MPIIVKTMDFDMVMVIVVVIVIVVLDVEMIMEMVIQTIMEMTEDMAVVKDDFIILVEIMDIPIIKGHKQQQPRGKWK